MELICMGDSITYGLGLSQLSLRWSDLVAGHTGHRLINCGVSGDTTSGMLARCQRQVFGKQADALLILGGINDISILGQYRSVCLNIISMVRQAQAEGLTVILGIPLPIVPDQIPVCVWDPGRDLEQVASLCQQYAAWIRAYADANQIPIVDFRAPFLLPDGQPDRSLFQDGLHPNEEGHRRMAQALCDRLERL